MTIPHLHVRLDTTGPAVTAKSEGVPFADESTATIIAAKYGMLLMDVNAVLKCGFDKRRVAVVRVNAVNQQTWFRFLILDRTFYDSIGDPFLIDEQYPVDWKSSVLSDLILKTIPLTPPTIEMAQNALKTGTNSALLLGGTQALIDGTRVLIARDKPDDTLFRAFWLMIPLRSRGELNVASYAPSNDLGFHLAILPVLPEPMSAGSITEDQARDYPPGRYELSLQTAIESGDQTGYLQLLQRRSSQETLRLAVMIVVGMIAIALIVKIVG